MASLLPYICEVASSRNGTVERKDINNDLLIDEVRKRQCLWDQESQDYGNRPFKAKQWEEIASEMNLAVHDLKGRWKHLKDSFNREVRNMARNGTTSSRWANFHQMSFLLRGTNSLLLPRVTVGDSENESGFITSSLFEVDSETQNTASSSGENESFDNYVIVKDEPTNSPTRKRQKTYRTSAYAGTNILNSGTNITNSTLSTFNRSTPAHLENNNEDYYFLMSLLPTFERISPQKKLRLKIKLMQEVYDAAFEPENTNTSSLNQAE